jgi:exonuclease III
VYPLDNVMFMSVNHESRCRVTSFNCKNMKSSIDEIRELCAHCDILLLQETWLMEHDLPLLSQISNEFYCKGLTAMDTQNGVVVGRPFGGIAILWRKSLGPYVKPITYGDSRLLGLEVQCQNTKLLLINTYLPCSSHENLDDFLFYLVKIDSIVTAADTCHCMVIGDFNADLKCNSDGNVTHLFGRSLLSFCESESLIISDYVHLDSSTVTYNNVSLGTASWLDHLVSTSSMHALIDSVSVDSSYITSDHFPLSAKLNLDCVHIEADNEDSGSGCFIKWDRLSSEQLRDYEASTQVNLSNVHLNHSLLLCDDVNCNDLSHKAAIERLYCEISEALLDAAESLQERSKSVHPQLHGWNVYVKALHEDARDAFLAWRLDGSQRAGPQFRAMTQTRAQFKRAVRLCKRESSRKSADVLANKLINMETNDFWQEIKKLNGNNIKVQASTIDGATGKANICTMWKNHYSKLLNSSRDRTREKYVMDVLSTVEYDENCFITNQDIIEAIDKLKNKKSPGLDGLVGEHIKHANRKIVPLFKMLFNCMLVHGHLPSKFMETVIVSIVKDKKGNISDKDNYRPIAITTVISKILELVILVKVEKYLLTNDNQFGFKKRHSTDMCVFMLKEICNMYNLKSSPVYVCMLDSSKAFDRINHFYLFEKLLKRDMPVLYVRLLFTWYQTQSFVVRWDNVISDSFTVTNGVRQGGVLSPRLFNVFIDELSDILCALKTGCYLNGTCFNHIMYADDSLLIAPHPGALQELIDVCVDFASNNDMMYNVIKSSCIAFLPPMYKNFNLPSLTLGNDKLKWVSSKKYLGVILSSDASDDFDIERQMKFIYAKGNCLISKFKNCDNEVKRRLFITYCNSLYLSHLWSNFKNVSHKRVVVAYNNIFRALFRIERGISISRFYVEYNISTFSMLERRYMFSFYSRAMSHCNSLMQTIVSSVYFTHGSDLFNRWNRLLFL